MFDISTTISRDSFTYFVWTRFDITNPIVYDKNKAIASQDCRLKLKALHCRLEALSMSEEIANDFYMTVSEKEEERWSYCQSLPLSSDGMMTHIAAKMIDTLSFDGAYPTWEKKLIGTTSISK